ncbi:MAG: fumarylacetoacetate hydrolase family protein [Deltaproteobacteria bacterium]|nr:fumarylacetoacetate hydrolase family protein [Deltaproteobacteria bacterium]
MRIVRFRKQSGDTTSRMGVLSVQGDQILDVSAIAAAQGKHVTAEDLAWWDVASPLGRLMDAAIEEWRRDERGKAALAQHGDLLPASAVKFLAPIARPGKVLCIGLNYRDHAAESGMDVPTSPILFSKFGTSIVGPDDAVLIPKGCTQPDYEAEMAVVIGRHAKHVSKEDAYQYVAGYCCLNDVSARDFQFADKQWVRGKAADTFAPIGPFVATKDLIPNPHKLQIQFRLNGETLQNSNTEQLVFGVPELVSFLSQSMTLEPGDIIATGTPPGVGFARKPPVYIKPGDRMEVEVEGLGVLVNPVAAAQ